jgi:peroxiredoxin
MPTIQTAFEKHQADGLMVLAIAVDDDRDDVQRFFDKYDLTFQPLLDDGTVASMYQVFGLPTSFFINADGEIVATHIGVLTARALEDYLAQTVTKDE